MKSTLLVLALSLIFLVSCGDTQQPTDTNPPATTKVVAVDGGHGQAGVAAVEGEEANALQVASSIDDFSTLVAAIKAGGVANAVVNTGPLTILAPLNSAFAKLPEGTVETLLKPENKAKLAFILTNHVAPANYPIKQLKKEAKKGRKLYMASGKYLEVTQEGEDIFVGGTKIIKSVKVSNGWIHVIDDVLVPAE